MRQLSHKELQWGSIPQITTCPFSSAGRASLSHGEGRPFDPDSGYFVEEAWPGGGTVDTAVSDAAAPKGV